LLLVLLVSTSTTLAPVSTTQALQSGTAVPVTTTAMPAVRPTLPAVPTRTPVPTSTAEGEIAGQTVPTSSAASSEPDYSSEPVVPLVEPQTPVPVPLSHRFTSQEGDVVTRIRPGVIHVQRVTNDPLRINVLLFDITSPHFDVKAALGDDWFSGRTRTSYMVRHERALAGINGDLFAGLGRPQGLTIINSRIAMAPKHRATFAWSRDQEPFIGYFTDSWSWHAELIAASGRRIQLAEYNRPCPPDSVCMHTEFVRALPYHWGDVKVLLGPSGRVFDIVESEAMSVDQGMRVVQGLGDGADWLLSNVEIGDTLTLDIQTTHPLSDYTQAISGGPIILEKGKFVQDCMCKLYDCSEVYDVDGLPEDDTTLCEDFDTYWKEAHYNWVYMPRTGVGYDKWKQTLIVAVVDGYQLGYSRGMLQREFADLFLEFGAETAMELDGGGSTTMVLENEIMNNPSDDTGERYVANALLFFWHDDLPDPRYPEHLRPPAWRAPALRPE
jgi:hypothetical protein